MFVGEEKLLVFVDAMPSEQGSQIEEDHISYTGILYSGDESKLHGIEQYKDLSKKGRINTSKLICDMINENNLWVLVSCFTSQVNIAEANGRKLLSKILSKDEDEIKSSTHLIVNNQKLNIKRANMYANYAIALAFMSGSLAQYVKHYKCKSGHLVLDLLPGDQRDPKFQPGIETIKWLTHNSSFLQMVWKDSFKDSGNKELGFCYANVTPDIGASLADWVAQSCHAAINAESFRANISGQREKRRRVAADIIFSIMKQYKERGKDPEKIIYQIPLLGGFS